MELLPEALEEDLTELTLSEMAQESPAAFCFLHAVGRLVEESQHNCSDAGISGLSGIANPQEAGFMGKLPGCKTT